MKKNQNKFNYSDMDMIESADMYVYPNFVYVRLYSVFVFETCDKCTQDMEMIESAGIEIGLYTQSGPASSRPLPQRRVFLFVIIFDEFGKQLRHLPPYYSGTHWIPAKMRVVHAQTHIGRD